MRPTLTIALATMIALPALAANPPAPAMDAAQAKTFLRQHDIQLGDDALVSAIGKGQPQVVAALLGAGLKPDGARIPIDVVNAIATGCMTPPVPEAGINESLAMIVAAGMPIDHKDDRDNTLLMSSAQFCPASVTAQLIALGATVDAVNKQDFTPLQMALVSGKWDSAQVLIDHGGRLTRQQIDQIFFEPPSKQSQRDLLQRATK